MKEVRYWEAEDGTKFEDQDDCLDYERKVRWGELLEIVPCYNEIYYRLTEEDTEYDEADVAFILIPDTKDNDKFWRAMRELDTDYFSGTIPFDEAKEKNDLLYFDAESETWRVWSADIRNLRQMENQFQLFEDKGE